MQHPPAIRSGDQLRVIAPSGPVAAERLSRGLAVLRRRFADAEIVVDHQVYERHGYLAGSDAVRLAAFENGLREPCTRLIWCARGGYGATRILARANPRILEHAPKPLVGFSDVTALLCWAYVAAGVPGVHGPVVSQLGSLPPDDLERVEALVRGEIAAPLQADEGSVLVGGTVEGPLIVGNLEVLRSLIGTPYMPSLEGCILGIEEIGERPYRLDRSLTQLMHSGALRGLRGVVVGQLTSCEASSTTTGEDPLRAHAVVEERLGRLGIPVVTGFPFGHEEGRHAALPFGVRVRLHADDATLECLEPVTSPEA
ncbi:MAG: LD-carboxypeptidase [Nannocystaceae bacterium]